METVGLMTMYGLKLLLLGLAAYGAGIVGPRLPQDVKPPLLARLNEIAHGFGVLGFVALLWGLAGALTPATMQLTLVIAVSVGAFRFWKEKQIPTLPFLPAGYWLLRSPLCLALFVLCVLCGLNVLVGALAPDAAQDSLWYHLACARAWLQWHRPLAWSTVYPSSYSVHTSLLYTLALAIGDEIDCSLLYAFFGFLTFATAACYSAMWYGKGAALWTWFLCATAYATHVWFVPINTGNDLAAALFATAGLLALLDALERSQHDPMRHKQFFQAAWLLGWGGVTKLTVVGYALVPAVALLVCEMLSALRQRIKGKHTSICPKHVILFILYCFIPFLPWAARSILYGSGNPVFPLFRDALPLKPEFSVTTRNISINTLYPFSLEGLRQVLTHIPLRLEFAFTSRSPAFLIHAFVVGAGLFVAQPRWRRFAFLAAFQWVVFFWSAGYNETVKYLAVCFPAAFVFAAAAVHWFSESRLLSRFARTLVLSLFAALLFGGYAWRQWEWARHETVQWPFRPILAHKERLHYLSTKPYQLENIYLYEKLNHLLPRDAVVLFPYNAYPFYLNRRYLWVDDDLNFSDYLKTCGVADELDLALFLTDRHVTHVLAPPTAIESQPLWGAVLDLDATTAALATSRLYRVRTGDTLWRQEHSASPQRQEHGASALHLKE